MLKIILLSFLLLLSFSSPVWAQYTSNGLFSAVRSGNIPKVRDFLKSIPPQEDLNTALGAAVNGNQLEVIEILVGHGADLNHLSSWNTHLLINAIMYGRFTAAEKLIELGADLNVRGYRRLYKDIFQDWDWTPLMCAARMGQTELIRTMIKKGMDPAGLGWSQAPDSPENAADIAAYSGHRETLDYLIKQKVTLQPETIYKVARGGNLEMLKYALKLTESDVTKTSERNGRSLLMEACWWGYIDIVNYCLAEGADPNQTGRDGYTALIATVSTVDRNDKVGLEILKNLQTNGAKIEHKDKFEKRALDYARHYKRAALAEYLNK